MLHSDIIVTETVDVTKLLDVNYDLNFFIYNEGGGSHGGSTD